MCVLSILSPPPPGRRGTPPNTSPGVFTFFSGAFCFLVVYHYQQPNKKKDMSQGASSQTIKPRTLKTHKGRND